MMTRKDGKRVVTVEIVGGPEDMKQRKVAVPIREEPVTAVKFDDLTYRLKENGKKIYAYHPSAAKLLEEK